MRTLRDADSDKPRKPRSGPKISKINFTHIDKNSLIVIIVSLAVAVGLFLGLVFLERYVNTPKDYTEVVVAIKDVPAGVLFTEDNAGEYFSKESRDASMVPAGAVHSGTELINRKLLSDLVEGEVVFEKDLVDMSNLETSFINPVEMTISFGSLDSADAGTIRGGDIVDITLAIPAQADTSVEVTTTKVSKDVDAESEEGTETSDDMFSLESGSESDTVTTTVDSFGQQPVVYMMENVYIKTAYNANGQVIPAADKEQTATMFQILVEKEDELWVHQALVNGSNMRVAKILNPSKDLLTTRGQFSRIYKYEQPATAEEDDWTLDDSWLEDTNPGYTITDEPEEDFDDFSDFDDIGEGEFSEDEETTSEDGNTNTNADIDNTAESEEQNVEN